MRNHFIQAEVTYSTIEKPVPAPYFRRTFQVEQKLQTAKIQICGLGFYQLHINGINITKGHIAPYRSNHDHYLYYDEYSIGQYIREGNNVIAILLGNGMQNAWGSRVWDFDKAPWRSSPKVSFVVQLEYENGEKTTYYSDQQTKTTSSPIIFDDLHWGEGYDARKEIIGWNTVEYDDKYWDAAKKTEAPKGELRLANVEPIKVRRLIQPVSYWKCRGNDGYIYDFGVNTSGVCRLTIEGSKIGQEIRLSHFETLVDEKPFVDSVRVRQFDDPYQEDLYICKGEMSENYIPHFTFHGFRYVYVTGITPEQAKESLLTYMEMSSDLKQAGTFLCSSEVANQIQEATVRSDTSNFYYYPMDCPHREKNGWTADAALSAEQMLLNLHVEKSLREWMRNVYKAIDEQGRLPGIIPTVSWGFKWGNGPAWDNVLVYIPYYVYKYTGDKGILEECAEPLMKYLTYLRTRVNAEGLVGFGLGDWCQARKVEEDFDTPLVVTDTIMSIDIGRKAEFIYEVLDLKEYAAYAKTFADELKVAFREHLIDKDSLIVYGDTQTAQAMAIYYGLFTEKETEKAYVHLLKQIEQKECFMDVGVLGGRVLFRVLAEHGNANLAYYMITRPEFPSYGNWMIRGATTLWETFTQEGGRILSRNHHFWGDVSAWFYLYIGGIHMNPTAKDVQHVNIAPQFVEALNWASASYDSPEGIIKVSWERVDEEISLEIVIPDTMHGEIVLPEGYRLQGDETIRVLKSGKYIVTRNVL